MLCLQKGKKSYTKNNPVYVTTILHCVKLWSILHIFERSTFIFLSFLSMNVLTIKFVVFFVAVERPKFWGRCKRFRKYNPLTTPSSHQHHPCNHPCTACQSKSKSRPSWRIRIGTTLCCCLVFTSKESFTFIQYIVKSSCLVLKPFLT